MFWDGKLADSKMWCGLSVLVGILSDQDGNWLDIEQFLTTTKYYLRVISIEWNCRFVKTSSPFRKEWGCD